MNRPDETAPAAGLPRVSPFCIRLGSKKLMLAERPPLADGDVLDASQHCWCERTYQVIGPDAGSAHPADCRKGRPCFESPLDELL